MAQYFYRCCNRVCASADLDCGCASPLAEELDKESWVIMGANFSKDAAFEERPWGRFYVLSDQEGMKVKQLEISPGQSISLQTHANRTEYWTVVRGTGTLKLGNTVTDVEPGSMFCIPKGERHQVRSVGSETLTVIEVQVGICDESDIIRHADYYGRV